MDKGTINQLIPSDADDKLIALQSLSNHHQPSEELLLSYVPENTKHIIDFCGAGILRPGYISSIVAPQGTGKSNVAECIVSSYLNHYANALGFKVDVVDRPLLWFDGERTRDDIYNGFQRIKRRILIENNPDLIDGNRFKNVHCHPLINYPSREYRIKELERLCELLAPGLVLLDGAADFVRNVNDNDSCVDFIALLTALANKHAFGVIVTIHPNPDNKADNKPRGILGSELIRTSESMLLLKRAPDDREVRILTTAFAHGKNRSENDNLETYFRWDANQKMFVECDYTPNVKPAKVDEMDKAFNEVLNAGKLPYKELIKGIVSNTNKTERTAERWVGKATESAIIFNDNGLYGLTPF